MMNVLLEYLTVLLEYFDFPASKVRPNALKYIFDLNQFLKLLGKDQLFLLFFLFPYMCKNATKPMLQLLEAFLPCSYRRKGELQHPKHPPKSSPVSICSCIQSHKLLMVEGDGAGRC